jgi:hypothetical protein
MAFRSSQNIANDYKKNDDNIEVELQVINIETPHIKDFNNTILYNDKDNDKDKDNDNDKDKYINNEFKIQHIRIKNDDFFILYYYKNSELIKEICKLIQFIILVGIFEYVFFITIVNKYKIANIDTILCNILSKIL